jgi:hypothetical protein
MGKSHDGARLQNVRPSCDFSHFKAQLPGHIVPTYQSRSTAMFQTTQTLHPVSTAFRAGLTGSGFENKAPSRQIDDREMAYKEFVKRLHALVWCDG